jgi:hypothetical protein
MYVHALHAVHAVHAVPDLRVAAGRLRDGVSHMLIYFCDSILSLPTSNSYDIHFLLSSQSIPVFAESAFEGVWFFCVDTFAQKARLCFQLGAPPINQSINCEDGAR